MNNLHSRFIHTFPYILFFLLLLNTISLFNRDLNLSRYGNFFLTLTIYVSIIFFMILFIKHLFNPLKIHVQLIPIYAALALLLSINVVSHLWNQNTEFDTVLLQLVASYIFFLSIALIEWTNTHLRVLALVANVVIVLIFAAWVYFDLPFQLFSSAYVNSNLTSIVLYFLLFMQILGFSKSIYRKKLIFLRFLLLVLTMFLVYVTSSRGMLLTIGVALLAWIVYKYRRNLLSKLFFVVIGFNFLFVFIYTRSEDMFIVSKLNDLSLALFGKDIFTGREYIWRAALDYGFQSPLLGHRIDVRPTEYMPGTTVAHVHNYYIQVFLESGILGLIACLLLFYVIWNLFMRNLDNYVVRIAAFFYLGVLFYWNMDLSSFFVNQAAGLLLWFIISIGVSASIYHQAQGKRERKERIGPRSRRRK